VQVARAETSFEAYQSARERFFEGLRRDAEIRRLERLWRLPSHGREAAGTIRNDD
jgi:hypothetical protein